MQGKSVRRRFLRGNQAQPRVLGRDPEMSGEVDEVVFRHFATEASVLLTVGQESRFLWEATSFRLERLQANAECVAQEESGLRERTGPTYELSFTPEPSRSSRRAPPLKFEIPLICPNVSVSLFTT